MALTTAYKRAYLRQVHREVETSGESTLANALDAAAAAAISGNRTGRVIIGSSTQGQSVSFALPSLRDATPGEIVELGDELLSLYTVSRQSLVDGGVTSPTDDQILAEMLDRLVPVLSARSDYTSLRSASP